METTLFVWIVASIRSNCGVVAINFLTTTISSGITCSQSIHICILFSCRSSNFMAHWGLAGSVLEIQLGRIARSMGREP